MGTRRISRFVCGEYVGAAATDTVMPRRTRVNGFIAAASCSHKRGVGVAPRLDREEKSGALANG